MLWAQAGGHPEALPLLALRRWIEDGSLSAPRLAPGAVGLGVWLVGLALLLMLAVLMQGPGAALRQLFDLPGHARLLVAALARLRAAAGMVAVLVGTVVVVWTVGQFAHYRDPARLEDLLVFTASRGSFDVATEQGTLAALTPLRDVCGLADFLPLLLAATYFAFRLSADRWGGFDDPRAEWKNPLPGWTTACWVATWLYAMERFANLLVPDATGLPLSLGFFPEVVALPVLMALSDGAILAWVLVKLRNATLGEEFDRLDVRGAVKVWPAAVLACLASLPARYVAPASWLFAVDLPGLAAGARSLLAGLILGWGLVGLQGAALATTGLVGAAAWSGGCWGGAVLGYARLLRAEGARLVVLLAAAGAAAGAGAGLAYLLVLALPRQSWLLAAADSYAHYATLAVGLVALSALVELGVRALPRAGLVVPAVEAAVASGRG